MAKTRATAIERIDTPEVRALLQVPGTRYFGACLVQAPGAWTRCGPSWHVPGYGWVSDGIGVDHWGTKRGLGQLATANDAQPTWHERSWTCAPAPNLVFLVSGPALEAPYMDRTRALMDLAGEINSELGIGGGA